MISFTKCFYGWKLAGITCLGNVLIHGMGIYVLNALIDPFSAAYGWTRGGMGLSMGVAVVCATLSIPLLSEAAGRYGLKSVMLFGVVAASASLALMGMTPHLWLFTLFFSLLWIAGQACGGAIGNALISNWFLKYRGRAFGLVNVGTSLSGVITPFCVLLLVGAAGLQGALCLAGALVFLVMAPCIAYFVRDTPEEKGLLPDGHAVRAGGAAVKPFARLTIPLAELFHSGKANRIGLAYGLGMMTSGGMVSQLKPRFTDLGFDDFGAMGLMAVCTFFAALGKFGWGFLGDRFGALRTAKLLFLWNGVGLALAFLPPAWWTMLLFSVTAGFGMGGFWTSFPTVVAHIYGRQRFLSAYRYVSFYGLLRAFGYVLIGGSSQMFSSYGPAYVLFLLAVTAAYFCLRGLTEEDREEDREEERG